MKDKILNLTFMLVFYLIFLYLDNVYVYAQPCEGTKYPRCTFKDAKVLIKIFLFAGIFLILIQPVYAQTIDCYATLNAWRYDKNLSNYMATHDCTCPSPNSRPVCTPKGGSSSSVPLASGGLSPKQQMTLMMMQSLFQPLFNAIFQDIFSPLDTTRQQEERKKQEEMKRQAQEAWEKAQKEIEAEMARQEAKRKEAGQKILAQSRIGEDVKLEPSLFGTYQAKLEANSISSGGYPAPENEIDRAKCAAYFSKLAKNTKDIEGAKFLSQQAEKVMQGAPTDYPCQFEKMPEPPVPQESYAKNEELEAFINTYQVKLKEFEDLQTKVNEARKQKLEAEARLKEADKKISELQTKSATISKPEEKAQIDDLLSQAMAVKQEAENDLNTAKENEQKILETAKQKADEIKSLNEQISSLKQENK